MIINDGGGVSTRPKPKKPAIVDLAEDENYLNGAAAKREVVTRESASERYRLFNNLASEQMLNADKALQGMSRAEMPASPTEAQRYRSGSDWADRAKAVMDQERRRRQGRDISRYSAVKDIVDAYEANGVTLTADDVKNAVDFGVLDSAANKVIAATRVGDQQATTNVLLTLQKTSPEMAALLPEYVQDKLTDYVKDPTVIDNMVGSLTELFWNVMKPFTAANEWTMEGMRAGTVQSQNSALGETPLSWVPMAQGFVSPEARAQVQAGKYNEQYIQSLRDSGQYSDLQIEIALDVSRRAAMGDPEPIISAWTDKYQNDPQASRVFRNLMYRNPEDNTQDLLRQIDSASLGNTGQVLLGSGADWAEDFDPARASELRQDVANVTGGVASFVYDPTNLLVGAGRMVQATKWSLARLAPGGESAAQVLRKARFGRLPVTSPAYRYFDTFTSSLNDLDDLEKAAAKATGAERTGLQMQAAGLRNRMTRQFDEMPEDLIEDFRTKMPRNADGKFDVTTAAAYIDDANAAYLTIAGEAADSLLDEGASELLKRDALHRLMDEQTFYGRVSAANQGRDTLVPRMSVVGQLRRSAANNIAVRLMPSKRVEEMLDKHLQSASPEDFAKALSANAVEFGADVRSFKRTPGEGVFDSATRMFSSLPDKNFVRITDASDAKRVYRLARVFFPKRASEMIAEAFRKGDVGDRRLIISGLVRSGAASRGLTMTADEADSFLKQLTPKARELVTGSQLGERYGVTVLDGVKPSQRAAIGSRPTVDDVKRLIAEDATSDEFVFHTSNNLDLIQSGLRAGDVAGFPVIEQGYGDIVHVFRKADMDLPTPKPIASFTMRQLGIDDAQRTYGARAQELGFEIEPPVQLTADELATEAAIEAQTIEEIARLYGNNGSNVAVSLSADKDGIEHALHMYQTSDYVAFPTLKDFEDLRDELTWGKPRNKAGRVAQRATDYWSLGTLFGLRFSLRNAIEEVGMYWLTGGGVEDLYKGRRASQAIRRVRPRVYVELVRDGNAKIPKPVFKSSLGMVANKADWAKRQMLERGFPDWMTNLVIGGFDQTELLFAQQAYAAGDRGAFRKFVQKSLAAQRLNGLSPDDLKALDYLVDSPHGMALLDEIAEAGKFLNSGGYPAFVQAVDGITDLGSGVGFGKVTGMVPSRFMGYENVAAKQVDEMGRNIYGVSFWWRELQATFDDGPIGEAAVRLLDDPMAAKKEVARIIREDTEYGYKQRFSRITDDMSVDEFADSYVENVFQHFTKRDGTLNEDLLDKLRRNGFKQEIELDDGSKGWTYTVTKDDLLKYDRDNRPEFVFGRGVDHTPWIPVAEELPSLLSWDGVSDRAFGWMGEQNARISREPIFIANYLDQYGQTLEARQQFAKALAKGGEATEEHWDLANRIYSRQALDNAYNLTLSYIDNPANRSNLAWKARNVSRYYRATEDFYRRAKRMAKHSPEAFWKGALTYQILSDTGFVYTDDNGDKYFAYPGNEYLQEAIGTVAGKFFGVDTRAFSNLDPFFLGGKVLGVAPSSDPNQLAPAISGPVAGATLASVFYAFPALAGLRAAVMGQYSQPTGSLIGDVTQAVMPAGVTRLGRLTDTDQMDSQLAQAGMDAIALMTAEGMLDKITVDGKPIDMTTLNPRSFRLTDQYRLSQAIAVGLVWAKTALGWTAAAAPQTYENNVSEFARLNGIDSMTDAFRDLIDKNKDAPDPMTAALSMFYAMQAPKMTEGPYVNWGSMLPFTMLSSQYNKDAAPVEALARPMSTDTVLKWMQDPATQDLMGKPFRSAAWFLAPRDGEFSWDTWHYQTVLTGMRVKKSEDDMLDELFSLQGRHTDGLIRRYYDEQIAAAPDDATRRELERAKKADQDANKAANPAWDTAWKPVSQRDLRSAFSQARQMVEYLRERDGELDPAAQGIENAINIYLYYASQKDGLTGSANRVKEAKASVDGEMRAALQSEAEASPQAAMFIETVIDELAFDPSLLASGGGQ